MDEILKRLEKIEKLIESQNLVRKDVLNFNECCDYLELSQSHLYKLTSTGLYRITSPTGRKSISEGRNWMNGCFATAPLRRMKLKARQQIISCLLS